jgi:hypothetical protein
VGAELFHADGQTDMTKLTVAFRSRANALKLKNTLTNTAKDVGSVLLSIKIKEILLLKY